MSRLWTEWLFVSVMPAEKVLLLLPLQKHTQHGSEACALYHLTNLERSFLPSSTITSEYGQRHIRPSGLRCLISEAEAPCAIPATSRLFHLFFRLSRDAVLTELR